MARRRSSKQIPEATVTITELPEPLPEETPTELVETFFEKPLDERIEKVMEIEASIPPEEYYVELLPPPQRQPVKQVAQLKPKPVRAQPRNIPRFSRLA